MSEADENLYFQSFHDDSVDACNGFEALCHHMKESLEAERNLIRYIEYKLAYEEEAFKQIKKIHEKVKKCDSALPLVKIVTDGFTSEGETVLTSIAEFRTSHLDPFKEKIKEAITSFDTLKSDTKFELKKRLSANDDAVKSCKNYTMKYRECFLFKKKISTVEQNDKMRTKLYKIDANVSSAEKNATVSVEVLKKSLQEWKKCFSEFTAKCLAINKETIEASKDFVVAFQMHITKRNCDINLIYSRVVEFDSSLEIETFYKNVVKERGTHKVFLPYVCINQSGADDKIEFTLSFCETDCPIFKKKEGTDAVELSKQTVSNSSFYNTKSTSIDKSDSVEKDKVMPPVFKQSIAENPPKTEDDMSSLVGSFRVAKFDYKKSNEDELEFKKGDVIQITGVEDEEWLVGKLGTSTGAFPLKFTEPTKAP